MTADHTDTFDESRIDDLLAYPSLNSEELEYTDSDQKQSTTPGRHHRTNSLQAIDRLTTKIACTRESIRKEQTARDGELMVLSSQWKLGLGVGASEGYKLGLKIWKILGESIF